MNASSLSGIAVSLAGLAAFCLPGVLLARRVFGGRISLLEAATLGLPLGLACNTGVSVVLTMGTGKPIAAALVSTAVLIPAAVFCPGFDSIVSVPRSSRRWTVTVFVSMGAILAVMLGPLSLVGAETDNGHAFGNYFNVDYLKNLALSTSLGRSGLPAMSPYLSGSPLRYYWFFLWFPGLLFRVGIGSFAASFMTYAAVWPLALVGMLFLWWRRLKIPSRWGAAALWLAVAAPSLNGAAYIGRLAAAGNCSADLLFLQDIEFFSPLNFARLPFFVDGLFRYLLYIQLHLFALLLVLAGLWILVSPAPGASRKALFLSAVPVGLGLFFSDVVGVLGVLAWTTGALVRVFAVENRRYIVPSWVKSGALIVAFAWLLAAWLLPHTRAGMHSVFLGKMVLHFIIEYGPLALFGCLGLWLTGPAERGRMTALYALFIFPAAVLFLVAERHYCGGCLPAFAAAALRRYPFHISVKTSVVLLAALLIPSARGLQRAAAAFREKPRPVWSVVCALMAGMLVLAALPGSVIDLGYHCDTAGLLRNVYISEDEMAALAWIRDNVARKAVFLCAPYRPGSLEHPENTVSVIPSLAYRDVLLGDPHHILLYTAGSAAAEMRRRSRLIGALRSGEIDGKTIRTLRDFGVTHVFLGPRECGLWGSAAVSRLRQLLPDLFTAGGVSVHAVSPDR